MNIDRIIVNNSVKEKVLDLELKNNEKYLGMLILNKISYAYLYYNKDNEIKKFINMSRDSITKYTGDMKTTYNIMNAFVENRLLEKNDSYQVDNYSKSYRPLFNLGDRLSTMRAEDFLSDSQLRNLRGRIEKLKDWDIEWHRENIIKNVELDRTLAIDLIIKTFNIPTLFPVSVVADIWSFEDLERILMNLNLEIPPRAARPRRTKEQLKANPKRRKRNKVNPYKEQERKIIMRNKLLELIELEKTDIKKGVRGGRHYHCLSNAPSEIKSCMTSKDPKRRFLWQIDIVNSQPFFLLALLKAKGYKIEEGLKADIIGGKFYESIGRLLGYRISDVTENKDIRKEVKQTVFRDIFFCRCNEDRLRSKKYMKIKKVYPLFCSAIEEITEKNKERTLASLLQETESQEVLPIVKKYKGFGIHDSVLVVATSDVDEIQKIIMHLEQKIFKKYGLKVSTTFEKISERLSDNPMERTCQLLALGID